ncbi:MAG: ATP-binding protein [Clostridia bacterium]|nr:ATP-binding protein [Clostridia bacterium]
MYERFLELERVRGHEKSREIFLRDTRKSLYRIREDSSLNDALMAIPRDRIMIYDPGISGSPAVKRIADIIAGFAGTVDVICMKDIPLEKTIRVLKCNEPIKERVVEFIKASDIGIEDCYYSACNECKMNPAYGAAVYPEDLDCLVSVHRGHPVKSISFDSDGALKLIALASYIIDAIDNGRTLVVDNLDSSLHYKLTRAIISCFLLDSNPCGQLIFTAQDVDLLDIQWLFRKDQIWFTANHADYEDEYGEETDVDDEDKVRLYSLNEFKGLGNGMDSDSYLLDRYSTGQLGSVQHPDYSELIIDGLGMNSRSGSNS